MGEIVVTIPKLMTVREVADALRCSRSQVYSLIYAGTIPTTKVAGKTLCRAQDIEMYITNCLTASGLLDSGGAPLRHSDTTIPESESDALSQHRRNQRLQLS